MKQVLTVIFIAVIFCSCKKQSIGPAGVYDGYWNNSYHVSLVVQKVDNDYIDIGGDEFVYRTTDQNRVTYSNFYSQAYFNLSFTTLYIHTDNPGVGTDSYFSGTRK